MTVVICVNRAKRINASSQEQGPLARCVGGSGGNVQGTIFLYRHRTNLGFLSGILPTPLKAHTAKGLRVE